MKKQIIAALAAAVAVSLSACSGGNQTTGSSSSAPASSAPAAVVSSDAPESTAASDASDSSAAPAADSLLKKTLEKVRSEVEFTKEMTEFTPKRIKRAFGTEEAQMEDYAGIICSDGLNQEQVIYIKAVDEAAADEIEKKMQDNWQATYNSIKNYDPDQVAMIEKAKVVREGLYVSLVISPNDEQIRSIFTAAINP